MTAIPPEAVTAAETWARSNRVMLSRKTLAGLLEAGAPLIAAAERERIRQLATARHAVSRRKHPCADPDCPMLETDQPFADLLGGDR